MLQDFLLLDKKDLKTSNFSYKSKLRLFCVSVGYLFYIRQFSCDIFKDNLQNRQLIKPTGYRVFHFWEQFVEL